MSFDRRVNFLKKNWQKINNRFSSIQIIVFYYLAMTNQARMCRFSTWSSWRSQRFR